MTNLRHSKPIPDKSVRSFIENLSPVEDLFNENISTEFKQNFINWLKSSKLNQLSGVEQFNNAKLTNGTVQIFDHFHYRYKDCRFRFFKGEFMYHQACLKNGSRWEWLNTSELEKGDVIIISIPFSDFGYQHPSTQEILATATKLDCPVLLDFAYYACTQNIKLDLDKYPTVETIAFSISKVFYGAEYLRVGLRLERNDMDDGIDVFNSVNMHNRIDISIANSLINNYPVDYNWNTYKKEYTEVCKQYDLDPTDCIMFGIGDDQWQELNRGNLTNRVCISDLIGEKINK